MNLFGFELSNPQEGTRSLECFYADGNDDVGFIPTAGEGYEDERVIRTKINQRCETQYTCATFTVTLLTFENEFMGEVRGYFSGTLYDDKPDYFNECRSADAHSVEGEFNLKLVK